MQDKITIKGARDNDLGYPIQRKNECCLYVTWFVLSRLKDRNFSLEQMRNRMNWRLPFSGTLPWGVIGLLKQEGLSVAENSLKSLSTEKRMDRINRCLQKGELVILLGKQRGEQHYVVLCAQEVGSSGFEVYDPLVGRTQWSQSELLAFWSGGGVLGFYKWYAMVVSHP